MVLFFVTLMLLKSDYAELRYSGPPRSGSSDTISHDYTGPPIGKLYSLIYC
jgi:hypothetical protein